MTTAHFTIADLDIRRGVVAILIDGLAGMLNELAAEVAGFHVADTRGILEMVGPDYRCTDGDWRDELQPSATNYAKLADRVIDPLIGRLVG